MAPAGRSKKPKIEWMLGDLVLAKVKGYPPWPAQVEDPVRWKIRSQKNKIFVVFFGPGMQIRHCSPQDLVPFSMDARNDLLEKLRTKMTPGMSEALREISEELEWRAVNPGQARRREADGGVSVIEMEVNVSALQQVQTNRQGKGGHARTMHDIYDSNSSEKSREKEAITDKAVRTSSIIPANFAATPGGGKSSNTPPGFRPIAEVDDNSGSNNNKLKLSLDDCVLAEQAGLCPSQSRDGQMVRTSHVVPSRDDGCEVASDAQEDCPKTEAACSRFAVRRESMNDYVNLGNQDPASFSIEVGCAVEHFNIENIVHGNGSATSSDILYCRRMRRRESHGFSVGLEQERNTSSNASSLQHVNLFQSDNVLQSEIPSERPPSPALPSSLPAENQQFQERMEGVGLPKDNKGDPDKVIKRSVEGVVDEGPGIVGEDNTKKGRRKKPLTKVKRVLPKRKARLQKDTPKSQGLTNEAPSEFSHKEELLEGDDSKVVSPIGERGVHESSSLFAGKPEIEGSSTGRCETSMLQPNGGRGQKTISLKMLTETTKPPALQKDLSSSARTSSGVFLHEDSRDDACQNQEQPSSRTLVFENHRVATNPKRQVVQGTQNFVAGKLQESEVTLVLQEPVMEPILVEMPKCKDNQPAHLTEIDHVKHADVEDFQASSKQDEGCLEKSIPTEGIEGLPINSTPCGLSTERSKTTVGSPADKTNVAANTLGKRTSSGTLEELQSGREKRRVDGEGHAMYSAVIPKDDIDWPASEGPPVDVPLPSQNQDMASGGRGRGKGRGRGRGRGVNGRTAKKTVQATGAPVMEPRLTRASSHRRNVQEGAPASQPIDTSTGSKDIASQQGHCWSKTISDIDSKITPEKREETKKVKSESKASLKLVKDQKVALEQAAFEAMSHDLEDNNLTKTSEFKQDIVDAVLEENPRPLPEVQGIVRIHNSGEEKSYPSKCMTVEPSFTKTENGPRKSQSETKRAPVRVKRNLSSVSTSQPVNSSIMSTPGPPSGKRIKVDILNSNELSLVGPMGDTAKMTEESNQPPLSGGKFQQTPQKGSNNRDRNDNQGKLGEAQSDKPNSLLESEIGKGSSVARAATSGVEKHGKSVSQKNLREEEKQHGLLKTKNSALTSLQEAGEKLRKGYLREKGQKHNVKILEPETNMRSLLEAARARKEQRSMERAVGTPPANFHQRGEVEASILPCSPADILQRSGQLSPNSDYFTSYGNDEQPQEPATGDTAIAEEGPVSAPRGVSSITEASIRSRNGTDCSEGTTGFPGTASCKPVDATVSPFCTEFPKAGEEEAYPSFEGNVVREEESYFLLEAEVARDTMASMLESLSRTRESIGKLTRFAMDSLHNKTHNQLIELIVAKMESEESFQKRGDLFLLLDSISQASSKASKSGFQTSSFLSDVEVRLKRALVATAPAGREAQQNRQTCHKCLDLWLQREVLPVEVLRPLIAELEDLMKHDEASREPHVGGGSRRPLRSERGLDDPLREMGDLLLDEYGSNARLLITGVHLGQSTDIMDDIAFPALDLHATYERVKEEALQNECPEPEAQVPAEEIQWVHAPVQMTANEEGEGERVEPPQEQNNANSFDWAPLPPIPPPPSSPPPSPPPLPDSPPPSPPPLPPSSPFKAPTDNENLVQGSPEPVPLPLPPPIVTDGMPLQSTTWHPNEPNLSTMQHSVNSQGVYPSSFPVSSQGPGHFPYTQTLQSGTKPPLPAGSPLMLRTLPPLPPMPPAHPTAPMPRAPLPPLPPQPPLSRPPPQPQAPPPTRPPPPPGGPPPSQQPCAPPLPPAPPPPPPPSVPQQNSFRGDISNHPHTQPQPQSQPQLQPQSAPFSSLGGPPGLSLSGEVELSGGRTHVPPWLLPSGTVSEHQPHHSGFPSAPQQPDWSWAMYSERGRVAQMQQGELRTLPGPAAQQASGVPPSHSGGMQTASYPPSAPHPPYGPNIGQASMQQSMSSTMPFMHYGPGTAPTPLMMPYPPTGGMPPHTSGSMHNIGSMTGGVGAPQQQQQRLGVPGGRLPNHQSWGVSPP